MTWEKKQGRVIGLGFYGGKEMGWDEGTHMCKLMLYGLNFPVVPKEEILKVSYLLSHTWYGTEVGVMGLKPVKTSK